MTEQNQNPAVTDDTEGHGRGNPAADAANLDSAADDTQGHGGRGYPESGDDVAGMDDVEGHTRKPRLDIGGEDEDDVEGHFRKPR